MATPKLPVSRLVDIDVILTPVGAQAQNLSTMLFLSTVSVIDVVERFRVYESYDAVVQDFGSGTAVKAAQAYFSQQPAPRQFMIGKWARSSVEGGLRCKSPTPGGVNASDWTGITSGGFDVTVDGGSVQHLTGLNFSAVTTMDDVAGVITAALTGAVCVWEPSFQRFTFRSSTTGAASAVSFLSAPGSGTDISDNLGGRSTDSGAYLYAGQVAESVGKVMSIFDGEHGQQWYALAVGFETDNDRLNFSAYIEATNNKHIYFTGTNDGNVLLPGNDTDIISQLKALSRRRTFVQYDSDDSLVAHVSAAAKLLSVNYLESNSALTLMFKNEPGVTPEALNSTQAGAIESKNGNVFVQYDNETSILQRGVMTDGTFADIVAGTDWLAVTVQTQLWNTLYTTPTKIPQTDAGVNLLVTKAEQVCSQAVTNGLLAPGIWNSNGFGLLRDGDYLDKGFYVYAPRVDSQLQADRAARRAPPIQVAAKLAGAIHEVSMTIYVNQ